MFAQLIESLATKRQTDPDKWVGATVTATDRHAQYGRLNVEDEALVRRCQQWVMVCATRNAVDCTDQPIRLYTKKKSGGRARAWTRGVSSRPVQKYLRDASVNGPGVKAAMYAERAGDVEEVLDHPLLDSLASPNAWQFGHDFFRLFYMFGELCGNRYVHLVDAPDGLQLYVMQSQNVRMVINSTDMIAGYVYGREADIEAAFTPDEVYHSLFMPSPFSPYRGVGPLHAVFAEADLDAASTESEVSMWRNGARPDWVFQVPPEFANQEYINQLTAKLNREHRGVKSRGKFLVAGVGDVKPLQFTPREMEYILGKENVEQRIWAAFGVPESEVKLNDSNLASARSGNVQRMRGTIKPRINAVAEELTHRLLPLYGIEPGEMWFAYDNCVPADVAADTTQATAKVGAGIWVINEARAEEGLEPIDGGDVPRVNGVPLDMVGMQTGPTSGEAPTGDDDEAAAAAKPAAGATGQEASAAAGDVQATALNGAQVTSLLELTTAVATGQLPQANAMALAGSAFPLIPPEQIASIFNGLDKFTPEQTPEQQARIESAQNPKPPAVMPGEKPGDDELKAKAHKPRSLKAYLAEHGAFGCCVCKDDDDFRALPSRVEINNLSAAAREWLDRMTASILPRLPQTVEALSRFRIFDRAAVVEFTQAIADPMRAVYASGIDIGKNDLPEAARDFDIRPSYEEQYLSGVTGKLVRSVTDTVDSQIRTVIQTGLEQGQTGAELTRSVSGTLSDQTLAAADRIARTEAQRVTHGAREIAWEESGAVVGKEWLLSGNPCPICTAMASKYNSAPLGQPYARMGQVIETSAGPFLNDFDDISGPPAHPNCACSQRPKLRPLEAP